MNKYYLSEKEFKKNKPPHLARRLPQQYISRPLRQVRDSAPEIAGHSRCGGKTDKNYSLAKLFEILIYYSVSFLKILGNVILGIIYILSVSIIFLSKEIYKAVKKATPVLKNFIIKELAHFTKKLLLLLANSVKKSVIIVKEKIIPWFGTSVLPFLKANMPLVANTMMIVGEYIGLAIFYLIKGIYGVLEVVFKALWKIPTVLMRQSLEFFSPKINLSLEKIKILFRALLGKIIEIKFFILWLVSPFKLKGQKLSLSEKFIGGADMGISYEDFRELLHNPRKKLLKKALASWLIFFIIVSSAGILSFTPFFDRIFGTKKYSYAASFTGAVKVSKGDTSLSSEGGWLKAMAYSGDGVNGDGDFQPLHPRGSTSDVAGAGTLAAGYMALPTVTANSYDSAGAQFIPWKPNQNGNVYGVIIAIENTNSSVANLNIVAELLRFPTASYSGTPPSVTWSNYVSCSALNTCTYAADAVIERRQILRFDQSISGESAYPGQYGMHYMDFRFDPPFNVNTSAHYGFRIFYNSLTSNAGWPRGTSAKPQINATNFGLGITDADTASSSTVTIPLANTNNMVALNSASALGQANASRTQNEHWTGSYSSVSGNWTITGNLSGAQAGKLIVASNGGTGAAWVNDGVPMTILTQDAAASTRLCVSSISGFSANQYIDIWDADTTSIQRIVSSVNSSDASCPSSGPSIIVNTALTTSDTFTVSKNATVAQAIWKLRIIQGAEKAFSQNMPSTTKICVADASQFSVSSVSNNINIWDNDSAVASRRITALATNDAACTSLNSLTIDTSITAGTYTTAQNARVAEISANFSNKGAPANSDVFRFTSLNMSQNPTKAGASTSYFNLMLAKTAAPATSANNYPWIGNLRHPFYIAYGDANTSAPVDGDMVVVGGGATDPDAGDSPNISNDLLLANISPHTVMVDKNLDMPLIYTGANGSSNVSNCSYGVGDGSVCPANTGSYAGGYGGFVSMLLTSRAKLTVSNAANQHYRLIAPGKIVLSSGAALELGSDSSPLPRTSTVDLYEDSSGPSVSTTLGADLSASATSATLASVTGFYIGDIVMIKDDDTSPILVLISAINSSTKVITFGAVATYYPWVSSVPTGFAYTMAKNATVSRGPDTIRPTGSDRRSHIRSARDVASRINMYSHGADNFRTSQANLAVDVNGAMDNGYLTSAQTVAGDTWLDVSGNLSGDWSALDSVSVAQGNSAAVNNLDSTVGMGANDDANQFPTWSGNASLGGNADAVYNPEIAEIGTIPLTNIYNANYNGGATLFSANYATSTNWTIFNDGANTETNDAVYFGDQGDTPVYALEFNIKTAISANATRVWEYWNGSTWTTFNPGMAWKYVPRGTNNAGLGEYCIPFNVNPTYPTATIQLTDTNTLIQQGQFVKIKDNDSPAIIRRISSVTAGVPANISFTEIIPDGYTTAQNAQICVPNGGQWMQMSASDLFSQTGRTLASWNLWDTPDAAKTTVNGISAYWVRNRISSFSSWTTSPVNQTTLVSMQGVEMNSASPLTVFNEVNEAHLNGAHINSSFDPNETWVLRYDDNSTATSTLKTRRWYESQVSSFGSAHRWKSPNNGNNTTAYYEKNNADADWRTLNGNFTWTDYNVGAKVYMNQSADGSTRKAGIFLRQDADDYGYATYISKTSSSQTLGIYSIANGADTSITTQSIAFTANTWYCLKAEASGSTIRAKFWTPAAPEASCGANEPGSWTVSATDVNYARGRFGLAADTMDARFDDVTVQTLSGDVLFTDNFNDTGCWRVYGSIHGDQGCAYASLPYNNPYVGFTIKHKGGVQSGEAGAQAVIGPLSAPEEGDEIYISPYMRGGSIGLDETAQIITSNVATKYEAWDFTYNPTYGKWDVSGSQYGSAGSSTPGSLYTSPRGEISLKVKQGIPTGPKFGNRAAYFQNSIPRGVGNFTGLNNQSSAIEFWPTWAVTGSATGYNIEGSGGTAYQKGTIDFWFKPNFSGSAEYLQYLFDYANQGNSDRLSVRLKPNLEKSTSTLEFVIWAGSTRGAVVSTNFAPVAGQWYHFRGAWEDSDTGQLNMARAWLDGAAFTTNQGAAIGARGTNAGLIRLGNSWLYNAGFDGAIDEFAVFDDAIDTSPGDNWGNFTPPASCWTGGQAAGTGSNVGANIFLAHFNSAIEKQTGGFQWADYYTGHPVLVYSNGADNLTGDRIRVITYPQRTRIWVDNTGSQYTPGARVKYSEGYDQSTETGWGNYFQYHHRAASNNAARPITSPVLNMRRQVRIWSDEDVNTAYNTAPVNQSYGALLYYPKEININNLELQQLYHGLYIANNQNSSITPYPTQYIRKSAFNNIRYYPIYTGSKTLGDQIVDGNNFFILDYNAYGPTEASSANITYQNNYFMGYAGSQYILYLSGGRFFTVSNNKFVNGGNYSLYMGSGTAKVTISNNEFWRYSRGIWFAGNAFVAMSDNTFDGGVSSSGTNGYYGTGIYVGPGSTNVEVTDSNSVFGRSIWNEADFSIPPDSSSYLAGSLMQYTGENISLNSKFHYLGLSNQDKFGNEYIMTTIPGVDVRFVSGTEGKDIINYTTYGSMRTTGAGLPDTVVRTGGGYGWRLESLAKDNPLEYSAKVVGVINKPLAVTGYIRLNSAYGTTNLPTVNLSGLGMTGENLSWTASATADAWQQFVVSGTPQESALADLKISAQASPAVAEAGIAENVDDSQGINLPTFIEDMDKNWTWDQWAGYKMRDDQGFVFDIIRNTANRLYLKGTRIPFGNILGAQAYGSSYEIFSPPYVYLDDISVLSGTVDTGTLDFHSSGRPVSPFLNTGLTAEAVWSAQYGNFADISGSMGQLLNDRMALKRGLINDTTASTTAFITNLTETTSNFYKDQIVVMMSGQNNGLSRRISSYDGAAKRIEVSSPFPFVPAMNESFVILSQYENNLTASQVWDYTTRQLTDAALANGGQIATQADINALNNISAADVWSYGARNLTGGVSLSSPSQIWNIATSTLSTLGSVGKLIVDNLNETISSRGTSDLTAADVWNSATRTITSIDDPGLQAIANNIWTYNTRELTSGDLTAKRVWDALLSSIATTNSIGELLKSNIDAAVSTRASLSALSQTETNLANNINQATSTINQQIEQTRKIVVGKIISQENSVKTGNPLTILFRADSGLTGNSRPKINVWDGTGSQKITDQYMDELGAAGVYKYLITFESVWGTGQFTVQASDDINHIHDTVNISVTSSDIASVANAFDLLANDLISVRSTVSTSNASSTVTSFGTNLISTADNLYNDALITFISGENAGVARRIDDYASTTKVLVVDPSLPFAPKNGDSFTILKQVAVPSTKISEIQSNVTTVKNDVTAVKSDVSVIKTDVAAIKVDVAQIKARLDNVDANISSLQSRVQGSVTQVFQVKPEEMFSELTGLSKAIQDINSTIGKLDTSVFSNILSVSQSLTNQEKNDEQISFSMQGLKENQILTADNLEYIKNKLSDFKGITAVQRQIIERPSAPIINTWYTTGSVDLNVMISNPGIQTQKIPVKIYLPKEAKMEHVMENGGLDIQFDVQLDTLYAVGAFELKPGESLKKTIKMRDIWQIPENDLGLMKEQAGTLNQQLSKTQLSAQSILLKNDVDARIDKILRTQKENTATPQDKIMTYRENKESLTVVEKNLAELKNLISQSAASQGFLGAFSGIQTVVLWGIIISFVTGFGLLVIILFSMWKHQMTIASRQLALQGHLISGNDPDIKALAKIFADGVIGAKERKIMEKHLSNKEIIKVEKKLNPAWSLSARAKLSLKNISLIVLQIVVAIIVILGLIFFLTKKMNHFFNF